jgi:hypothetical protein
MSEAQHFYHRAFGYIITKTLYSPENTVVNHKCNFFKDDTYVINGPYVNNKLAYESEENCIPWLMVSGKMEITNIDTGEIEMRTGGESNLITPEKIGRYRGRCLEPSVVFSIWPENNTLCSPTVPLIDYFHLNQNENYIAPVGTKLFLASGTIEIESKEYKGSTVVGVKTKPGVTMTAISECYGFLFK